MTKIESKSRNYGISWTLKKEVAEFFAYTYIRNHAICGLRKTVKSTVINKSDVVAFFNGRKEFEIIYISK